MRLVGKIKWYSKNKKFGFISSENNEDSNIFFRIEKNMNIVVNYEQKK